MKLSAFRALSAGLLAAGLILCPARADDSAPTPPTDWQPPSPEVAKANHLLPPDTAMRPGHHSLLERWTDAFGLTKEQQLWIEPQLHNEESLTKPVLGYKALSGREQQQILLIIKLAARRQIKCLLTPAQQKLMDEEIESTKEQARKKMGATE